MSTTKNCTGGHRAPYEKPWAEIIESLSETLMANPASWNPGEGDDLPIKPGDPDPDDDFKGAKGGNWDSFDNLWD